MRYRERVGMLRDYVQKINQAAEKDPAVPRFAVIEHQRRDRVMVYPRTKNPVAAPVPDCYALTEAPITVEQYRAGAKMPLPFEFVAHYPDRIESLFTTERRDMMPALLRAATERGEDEFVRPLTYSFRKTTPQPADAGPQMPKLPEGFSDSQLPMTMVYRGMSAVWINAHLTPLLRTHAGSDLIDCGLPTLGEWTFAVGDAGQRLERGGQRLANFGNGVLAVARSGEANNFGLYNMLGGVWEMTCTPTRTDSNSFVDCGGAWNTEKVADLDPGRYMKSQENHGRNQRTGFRVALRVPSKVLAT